MSTQDIQDLKELKQRFESKVLDAKLNTINDFFEASKEIENNYKCGFINPDQVLKQLNDISRIANKTFKSLNS